MNRFSYAFASLLVLAATAFVGCGNQEAQDYTEEVNDLQAAYIADARALAADRDSAQDAAEATGELARLTEDFAADVEAVEPPEDVAELHEQLIAVFQDVAAQLRGFEEDLPKAEAAEFARLETQLQQALIDSQTEIRRLIDEINAQLQE